MRIKLANLTSYKKIKAYVMYGILKRIQAYKIIHFLQLNLLESHMEGYKRQHCRFFAQGRCSYGNSCKFSHQGFQQMYLIRHAESIFNSFSDNMQGVGFLSQEAKQTFQLNQKLIDCGLTEKGIKQAENIQLPSECYIVRKKKTQNEVITYKMVDLVFVSPLNRALQTAKIILKKNKIKARRIIVLPELSEVLSKVCDFSLPTQEKKKMYEKFSFEELDNLQKISKEQGKFWQDKLLDEFHHKQILHQSQDGSRYMRILGSIFPTPLQDSESCFQRTMIAIQKIQQIAQKQNASKIMVVSHNRILKYICGRNNSGRAPSFLNCEVRKVMIQQN